MAPSVLTTNTYNDFINDVSHGSKEYGLDRSSRPFLSSKDLVMQVMKEKVAEVDIDTCAPGEEDAFYVADLGEIYRQHLRWKLNLKRVKPFYGT